jgi:sugar (pentulose or hexulose) kinase
MAAGGGSAKSDVLMQLKADISGRRQSVLKNMETGTIALALLCAHATGRIDDLAQAARAVAGTGASYVPDPEKAAYYASQKEKYGRIFAAVKGILR